MADMPQVSIIWLNYNGMKIKDIMLQSLRSIFNINYPGNIELYVVDNGSTDGSRELIENIIKEESFRNKSINIKKLFLDKNYGFIEANNIAYRNIDKASKYLVLINNDFIVRKDSLLRLIHYLENRSDIGAIQGVHLNNDNKTINNAGYVITNLLIILPLFKYYSPSILKKPILTAYTCGCYTIYRIEALKSIGLVNYLFEKEFFAYFDDTIVGLKLWNNNIKSVVYPIVSGVHVGSATFSLRRWYYIALARGALYEILEFKNKQITKYYLKLLFARLQLQYKLFKRDNNASSLNLLEAFELGREIGRKLVKRGLKLDLYKAPHLNIPLYGVPIMIVYRRFGHRYFKKLLKELELKDV